VKLLVYGAGVTGSLFSARLHEAGHDVSLLARGERLAALRRHGVQLAEGDSRLSGGYRCRWSSTRPAGTT